MDQVFIEAFATDPGFVKLFIKQTECSETPFDVVQVEHSKVDSNFGESDITVILDVGSKRLALLIENKIDAIAMPDQHDRYIKRGYKGIANKEYDTFNVLSFALKSIARPMKKQANMSTL